MTVESAKEEILINVTPNEVRAALLENGVVQEVHIERAERRGVISNIYKGRVMRVLPGMQAAFIEIGLQRTAFLHMSDIINKQGAEETTDDAASIRDLVKEGDEMLVQVVKDPIGNKGARLTTFITLPSRHLVLIPNSETVGVSARIEDEGERDRLRAMLEGLLAEQNVGCGVIVRTVAEGADIQELRADLKYLTKLWEVVQQRCSKASVKTLVHEDLSLPLRVLRDFVTSDVEHILVDSEEDFAAMHEFSATFLPEVAPMLELYQRRRPIFDLHSVEDEIRKALDRTIALKSGGYIIFDQTEAMTTIDVNTGAYVGHRNLEETIYRTNLEAAVSIATTAAAAKPGRHYHHRLYRHGRDRTSRERTRDAGAIASEGPLAPSDHASVAVGTGGDDPQAYPREPATRALRRLSACSGRGFVLTAETVCFEVFREVNRQSRQFEFDEAMVLAHQGVIDLLLDEQAPSLAKLEETDRQDHSPATGNLV